MLHWPIFDDVNLCSNVTCQQGEKCNPHTGTCEKMDVDTNLKADYIDKEYIRQRYLGSIRLESEREQHGLCPKCGWATCICSAEKPRPSVSPSAKITASVSPSESVPNNRRKKKTEPHPSAEPLVWDGDEWTSTPKEPLWREEDLVPPITAFGYKIPNEKKQKVKTYSQWGGAR